MGDLVSALDRIEQRLISLTQEQSEMTQLVEELTAAVASQRDVVNSVLTLIGQLADAVEENVDDPEALMALVDDIKDNTQALAEAVQTYTPPEEPEPEPEPGPEPEPEPWPSPGDGDVPHPPGGGGPGGGGDADV